MTLRQCVVTGVIAAVFVGAAPPLSAQSTEKFTARLAWVPTAGAADRANVTGKGTATGTLAGRKFTITGSFEGLAAPATVARLHQGIAKGARGNPITDLTVTKAAGGMLSGSVDLTPAQIESLRQGKLYIQLHSEKGVAPDGSNLWGWFLK
ncbi:MAG TPA: CHRD domain-containing protein [Vicinamibacterales bacterium]|nr:CHRD domain-containing protein [Vicinamibacterales bacterium]